MGGRQDDFCTMIVKEGKSNDQILQMEGMRGSCSEEAEI